MNPLEERLRFPFEDRELSSKCPSRRTALDNPEVPRPERIDPATPALLEEVPEAYWEGQEGVGPTHRDIVKREEQGERGLLPKKWAMS
jgi:hypothetical protein